MLTPDEIATKGPRLYRLGLQLVQAFGPESDGGKKLTRDERIAIGREVLKLLPALIADIVD